MRSEPRCRFDGSILIVRIRMSSQRPGGRKLIVGPDGSEIVPSSKPQPDGTLVKALARAWRWQRMLDEGVYASVSDIGDAENISKSYVRCSNRAGPRLLREAAIPHGDRGTGPTIGPKH